MAGKRTISVDHSTLGELRNALQELSNAGVPDDAELRVKIRASFNTAGGLAREVTVTPARATRD